MKIKRILKQCTYFALVLFCFQNQLLADRLKITFWNATMERPASVENVKIYDLSQQMRLVMEKNNIKGDFLVPNIDINKNWLVVTSFHKVSYMEFVKPSNEAGQTPYIIQDPAKGEKERQLRINLYENKRFNNFQGAGLATHIAHVVLEKTVDGIMVQHFYHITNNLKVRNNASASRSGKFAGMATVSINNGIPFQLHGADPKSVQANATYNFLHEHAQFISSGRESYRYLQPLKPGKTELRLTYTIRGNMVDLTFPFSAKTLPIYILPQDADTQLNVYTGKTKMKAESVRKVGTDTQQNYTLYEAQNITPGKSIKIALKGGSMVNRTEEAHNQGRVTVDPPSIAKFQLVFIIPFMLLIFIRIFYYDRASVQDEKNLQNLIQQLADLEVQKDKGKIDPQTFKTKYGELESKSIRILIEGSFDRKGTK